MLRSGRHLLSRCRVRLPRRRPGTTIHPDRLQPGLRAGVLHHDRRLGGRLLRLPDRHHRFYALPSIATARSSLYHRALAGHCRPDGHLYGAISHGKPHHRKHLRQPVLLLPGNSRHLPGQSQSTYLDRAARSDHCQPKSHIHHRHLGKYGGGSLRQLSQHLRRFARHLHRSGGLAASGGL